jgi:hypothetical protein
MAQPTNEERFQAIMRTYSFVCKKSIFSACLSGAIVFMFLAVFIAQRPAHALGQKPYVSFAPVEQGFPLVQGQRAATMYVDANDDAGVQRAVHDLQADVNRVSGQTAKIVQQQQDLAGSVVLIGTLGKSRLIDDLVQSHKLDATAIAGKWESTLTEVIAHPWPGVAQALVIAGSDRRGAIYGVYDLSEQIGVSPWYWWADVPVTHHDSLFVLPTRVVVGEPAVKYRGIFLNDEAPALTGWTDEKFGGRNHLFYAKVFELLLRLRGNCLWPAMWTSAFNEDDPLNPELANEYGIVMGTSHHEPMLRAQQEWKRHGVGEWDYSKNPKELQKFWEQGIERNKNYESIITLGMRGDGDMPMPEGDNIALLEKIVTDQRAIIERHKTPTLTSDPQVWSLYKEVQDYYDQGMRVPDDVTLLWSDDNWGNLRRVPVAEERKRAGGAGIYYHFDYVGDPRNYKWINTNSILKTREQMNLAYQYGATRIWVVNVGDLKPMEFPIEFFLNYAWDPNRWGKDDLTKFTEAWATREFGAEHAPDIADMVLLFERYIGRRKPELLSPKTFSLVNYHEADRIEEEWVALSDRAEKMSAQLPDDKRDAFFELVLHPIQAMSTVTRMYIAAGRNQLYATQGRASANDYAAETRRLFAEDGALSAQYNHLASGKWNHMMDQVHIGYTYWSDPLVNTMPAVSEVVPSANPHMSVTVDGDTLTSNYWEHTLRLPAYDVFNQQTRDFTISNSSLTPLDYTATASESWIVLSKTKGRVEKDETIHASVDWSRVRMGTHKATICIKPAGGWPTNVEVVAVRPQSPEPQTLEGFVESEGVVSIEAEHATSHKDAPAARWVKLPGFGETLSAMTIEPVTASSVEVDKNAPELDYHMYLFSGGDVQVQAVLAPSLNILPGHGLRYAISFDDAAPVIVDALADKSVGAWSQAVSDGVRKVTTTLNVNGEGYHTLRVRMVDPAVVLEKLVVSHKPLPSSYLGPPESYYRIAANQ